MTSSPRTEQAKKAEDQRVLERRSAIVRSSRGLLPYGTPEELAEMVGRFKFMVPGGDKLEAKEVWALAQAAYVHGLNPIIGECWWIKGSGFMPGIRGLRRLGREQLLGQDAHLDIQFVQVVTPADREKWKVPPGALAFLAVGRNSDKRKRWVEDAKTLREALGPQAPFEAILGNIGPNPETVGVGYLTAEQMDELDNPRWYHICGNKEANAALAWGKHQRELRGKEPCPDCGKISYARENAMPHAQRAMKRAEAHLWKQECDLPFAISASGDLLEDFDETTIAASVIEGAFKETALPEFQTGEELEAYRKMQAEDEQGRAEHASDTREELKAAAEDAVETLYGDQSQPATRPIMPAKPASPAKPATLDVPPPAERMFDTVLLDELIKETLAPDRKEAAAMLGHSPWRYKATPMKKASLKAWCRGYNRGIDEGLEPDAAASAASEEIKELEGTGG